MRRVDKCQKYGIWSHWVLTLIDSVTVFYRQNLNLWVELNIGKDSLKMILLHLNSLLLCRNFMLRPRLEHKAREKRICKLARTASCEHPTRRNIMFFPNQNLALSLQRALASIQRDLAESFKDQDSESSLQRTLARGKWEILFLSKTERFGQGSLRRLKGEVRSHH